ncbi:MAG: hypothetical protein GF317_06925, partial [Candidatus Lokiarchaeota archaeon]|nr:hypothetical protein [Candidatus Lokiarchaeota archaeon]MBD3199442.1 hypothetical protein [Candidatus Lokiarchaeota archaeon]
MTEKKEQVISEKSGNTAMEDATEIKQLDNSGSFSDFKIWKHNIWKVYIYEIFIAFHLISGVLIPFFVDWGGLEFVEIMFLQSYFTTMILVFEIPCGAI